MFDVIVYISFLLVMLALCWGFFRFSEYKAKKAIKNEFVIDEIIKEANSIICERNAYLSKKPNVKNIEQIVRYLTINDIISHYTTLDVDCIDIEPESPKKGDLTCTEKKLIEEFGGADKTIQKLVTRTTNNAKRLYEIKHPIKSKIYNLTLWVRTVELNIMIAILRWLLKILDGKKPKETNRLQEQIEKTEKRKNRPVFPNQDNLRLA